MQSGKWILTSLVMTFFGIPILAQFLAAVVAMLGAGLAAILEVCNLLFTPTIYLLLNVFMLTLGAIIIFFSGRVWAGDSAPEKREIAAWRQCFFSLTRAINPGWLDNRATSGRLSISPDGIGLVGKPYAFLAGCFVTLINQWRLLVDSHYTRWRAYQFFAGIRPAGRQGIL